MNYWVFYPTISDSTTAEITIRRHIEGIRKLLNSQYGNTTTSNNTTPEEEEAVAGLAIIMNNPATENHFELQIRTLQDAPRDPDKLRELLKIKQRQYEKAWLLKRYNNHLLQRLKCFSLCYF